MKRKIVLSIISSTLAGCAMIAPPSQPPEVIDTQVVNSSTDHVLPLPKNGKKLIVGIYNCFDTTGQKKKTSNGSSDFSSAVPQDCAPMLMSSLRAYPHYRVLERSRVDDILKERQLASIMYGDKTKSLIGNMLIADILMLGQIVSYDRTTSQSSGGLALNAIGASQERVSDTFTFSLRAVSTKSGEILNEVLVKKSVDSLQSNGHILKIIGVDTQSIEFGGASNEPSGLALQQAIQLAVRTLTEKGLATGWWGN